jgi:hypothetical protein
MAARKKKQREKKSIRQRMADRVQGVATLGNDLVTQPKAIPKTLSSAMKRSVHRLWMARGGGFYAAGFVVSFLWRELSMLFDEISQASSVGGFFGEQLIELLLRFTIESLTNTMMAFMWPLAVIQLRPPLGIIMLLLAYLAFARFVKEPLGKWLFDGDNTTTINNHCKSASEHSKDGQDNA